MYLRTSISFNLLHVIILDNIKITGMTPSSRKINYLNGVMSPIKEAIAMHIFMLLNSLLHTKLSFYFQPITFMDIC